jgi:hypothetical protein
MCQAPHGAIYSAAGEIGDSQAAANLASTIMEVKEV